MFREHQYNIYRDTKIIIRIYTLRQHIYQSVKKSTACIYSGRSGNMRIYTYIGTRWNICKQFKYC